MPVAGHAFLLSVACLILCHGKCTFNGTNNHEGCISVAETWKCDIQGNFDRYGTVTRCFCSATWSTLDFEFDGICITKPDGTNHFPRDHSCLDKNNEVVQSALCKGRPTIRQKIKKKWSKSNTQYYSNCVASFNLLQLTIELSGDVHPMPGPERTTNIKQIPVHISRQDQSQSSMPSRNSVNNTNVKIIRQLHLLSTAAFRMCLLNVRSVRNKASTVKDFTVDHDLDVLIITETWLRPGNLDAVEIGTLCPTGYRFLHAPRPDSTTFGGGIGFLFKETLDVNTNVCAKFKTFEVLDVRLKSIEVVRILCVYRPPDESTYALFYEEFSRLLERILAEYTGCLLITGDFNFHLDDPRDNHGRRLADILDAFGLKQHVSGPTHKKGHTLDLVITRSEEPLVKRIIVSDPAIADHFAVHCDLRLQKPHFLKKMITFRKLRSIDIDSLCEDVQDSNLLHHQSEDLNSLVDQYDSTLCSILDKHAPIKQRQVTIRPSAPWYNQEVALEKNKRRRLERKWRSSKLLCDRERYVYQCSVVNNLISNLKTAYYKDIIKENSGNQKVLFTTVNKLLQKTLVKRYPPSADTTTLANSFADFFTGKIDKIRSELNGNRGNIGPTDLISPECSSEFSDFTLVSQDTIKEYVYKSALKSCNLDPVPASVMKNIISLLLPTITMMVNLSLSTGTMPDSLKVAELLPTLKKPDADQNQFSSFRPISNLKMVSKVIEKVAAIQLTHYVTANQLDESFQSAYKLHHSTETALVRVQNDVLRAIDNNKSVILLLLDLSAAFDTVDHSILLSRLFHRYGIKGNALAWFESYLKSRKYYVHVEGCKSTLQTLSCGVPQGSVLGPLLYVLYTAPVAEIIKSHNLEYHCYADDTQLYVTFKTDSQEEACLAKARVECCAKDIDAWMVANKLKLNDDKTELLVFSSKYRTRPDVSSVEVGKETIKNKSAVRSLGVVFDQAMTFDEHISKVCKSSQYHLRNLGKIRKYLDQTSTETLIHAFVTSKLDYCNVLLNGLPKYQINRLQLVMNTAARVVTYTRKYDHITPVLIRLHWLPVSHRITFKILLLIYKALNGLAPSYLSDLLIKRCNARTLRSSSQELLTIERTRTVTYGDRAFSIAGPKLWNKLPLEIRKAPNINNFKGLLKTYLFKQSYF